MTTATQQPSWLKMGIDFGPVLVFGLSFFVLNRLHLNPASQAMVYATAVLVAASLVAVIVGFVVEKRIAYIPLMATLFAIPFGILTIVFKDPVFIKIKVTIVFVLIASLLIGGLLLKKQPLKALVGESLRLKEEAWPRLTLYYAGFYLIMAGLNEWVWRTQSDAFWVSWKLGSMFGGPFVLMLILLPFFAKNMLPPEAEEGSDNKL